MEPTFWADKARGRAPEGDAQGDEWYGIVMSVPEANREATYNALMKREGLSIDDEQAGQQPHSPCLRH